MCPRSERLHPGSAAVHDATDSFAAVPPHVLCVAHAQATLSLVCVARENAGSGDWTCNPVVGSTPTARSDVSMTDGTSFPTTSWVTVAQEVLTSTSRDYLMPRLHQINALLTGRKGEAEKAVTETYKIIQKESLFDGRQRTYKPHDEENGEKLPPEKQMVQQRVRQLMADAAAKWTELWDMTMTQDSANQLAAAEVVVDGKPILTGVPVTTLLFLEKQINDVETFVSKMPTPDPAEEWEHDPNTDLLKTKPLQSVRTKKVPRNHVKAEATDKHPAQVEVYHEDIQVGTWTQTLFTGRITAQEKNVILARVKKLKDAVKMAREKANSIDVQDKKAGEMIFAFLFGK